MANAYFNEQLDDILSSGMGEMSDWHKEQLVELFSQYGDEEVREHLKDYYSDPDVVEWVTSEELSFIKEQTGLTISLVVS